jgi:hypothetical protein
MDPQVSNYVVLAHLQNVLYDACVLNDAPGFGYVVEWTTKILGRDWFGEELTKQEKAFAFDLRAKAHSLLGEKEKAVLDSGRSIRADEDEPYWYLSRARFWGEIKRPDLASIDVQRANAILRERRGAK